MKPEDIKITDWGRMFIGDVPPEFFIEILIRVTFVYLLLIISMRLLGKRMASQLTRTELAAIVSLAAAVGVPILSPDRGLLPALVIAIVVVGVNKLIATMSAVNRKVEVATQGTLNVLVKDSVLDQEAMIKTRISKERIMSQLRAEKVMHLGEVQRLYMEANGNFTLIKTDKPKPGLPVLPESDVAFLKELKPNGVLVCHVCGKENTSKRKDATCPNCHHQDWVVGVET
jgi:uncharacterized membrane protein YcaP (DUF421 family)